MSNKFLGRSIFLSNPIILKAFSAIVGSGTWLLDAIRFDVYNSKSRRLHRFIGEVYDEVAREIPISSPARTRDVIKTVLINLWITAYFRKPVRFSRDRSAYTSARRYGRLFLKYNRLIPVIDALESLGYLEQKIGFKVLEKELGFQTRMWATEALVARFEAAGLNEPGFFTASRLGDCIILKDAQGRKIQYIDTPAITRRRKELVEYNNSINNSKIKVVLNGEVLVSNWFVLLFFYTYVIKGTVRVVSIQPTQTGTPNQYHHNYTTLQHDYHLSTMTQSKRWKHAPVASITDPSDIGRFLDFVGDINTFARGFSDKDHAECFLNQECPLKDLGIERLEFQLMDEALHRVYNNGSFKQGGRFYGALHQSLSGDMRKFICIDDQETVELDFSAHHIRMLYHMEGIDYRPDPYLACEGKAMRKQYKSVALIAINAANTREASGAIYDELKERKLALPPRPRPIKSIMETFMDTHAPIRKYLFSGVGLELQNKDSNIMHAILIRLMDMAIIGLPVHDSVIVQARHKDVLEAVMVDEYRKQMGFAPIVK